MVWQLYVSLLSFAILVVLTSAAPTGGAATYSPDSSTDTTSEHKQGWTSQPNGRGTVDILWSSLFTMSLCSWSALCVNVPSPKDNGFAILKRKFFLTMLGFVAPEIPFVIALGQWISARNSVKQFRESRYDSWNLQRAFFTEMGGFMLHSKDWPTSFPINAKQLHYLVTKRYVKYPELSGRMIQDKDKVDSLLRVLTTLQTFWFAINLAGRAAQGLAITTLEVTAGAFVLFSVCTVLLWFRKPADVLMPLDIHLENDLGIADILKDAGEQTTSYDLTPLDFIGREHTVYVRIWAHYSNTFRKMHVYFKAEPQTVDRWSNTHFHDLGRWVWLGALLTAAYMAIFVSAWNYIFPTHTEKILWRVASLVHLGILIPTVALPEFIIKEASPRPQEKRSRSANRRVWWRAREALHDWAEGIRNNSAKKDPKFNLPVKYVLIAYVCAILYGCCRGFILLEDIIALRSLPASAYESVDWWAFLPHF